MSKFSLYYPIKPAKITQSFGVNGQYYRDNGINIQGHNGIDFAAYDGQEIRAAHDGEVTFTGEDGGGGLGVVVRTLEEFTDINGKSSYWKSCYWHCQKNSFKVKPGDKIKVGDILALADNTGLSTGTHLHFSVKPVARGESSWIWYNLEQNNGYLGAVDPSPYFNKYYAENAGFVLTTLQKMVDTLQNFINNFRK